MNVFVQFWLDLPFFVVTTFLLFIGVVRNGPNEQKNKFRDMFGMNLHIVIFHVTIHDENITKHHANFSRFP